MSYILDALKKSEQERGHGAVPGVQTIHSSSLNYHDDKKSIWPTLLFALVFINITVLAYFILTNNKLETAVTPQQPITTETAIKSTQPPSPLSAIEESPEHVIGMVEVVSSTTPPQSTVDSAEIINDQSIQKTRQTIETIDLYDLPLNIKQQIPALVFSAHIYSTNATQRSIMINGRLMEEGDAVTSDLFLSGITSDGAIFDYKGYRFSTSVLSGWNIN